MSYSIDTVDINLRVSPLQQKLGFREGFSIASYNIQKTSQLSIVARLASNYDILLIQEFTATKKKTEAMVEFATRAHRQFVTSPTGNQKFNYTGIFINPNTVEVLGVHELNSGSIHKRYSTDIRVKTKEGNHVIFQSLYLPSDSKDLHKQIIEDTAAGFEDLKDQHESLQIFYGGDFNNSVENTASTETEGVLALDEFNLMCKNEDVAQYDPMISVSPTNRSSTCRRLDRFYAPRDWRLTARQFQILDPLGINSSHNMIAIKYVMKSSLEIQVGPPRFQFPLRRLQPPFNRARTWPIPRDASMDEVIHSIKSDAHEYIEFMGYLRKNDPQYMQFLLTEGADEEEMLPGQSKYKAAQTFYQAKKTERVIFKTLRDEAKGTCATTTPAMVKLATTYFREIYLSPPLPRWNELKHYLRPMKSRVTYAQRQDLEKPFTANELESALKSMDKSTAPGPDGIQYSVLQYYWEEIGSSLARAANAMMDTGNLPKCFQQVLITLIPKHTVEGYNDIKNQRPISLSNTCLKVISKAVCRRLQKIMQNLIGPYQRGFIRDRKINHNTMEFFTMLDMFKRLEVRPMPSQAVLLVDFTKAFDRISHHYMRQVMYKVGFGSQLIRLIMLIMADQEAQIYLNNWEGEKFPIRCGTRQGNPLSPLLFNLALEPLLVHLDALKGIPIVYEGIEIEHMKYHAFADDVNIYLGEDEDYAKVAEAIKVFEQLSNSRVSETKTKLLGLHPGFAQYQQTELPYPQSHIWSANFKYLGLTVEGVDWQHFISKLPFMTMKQGYMHLDIITRAIGTNTFVSSKTVYKDLVQCMPTQQLKLMDKGIHRVFKGVSTEKLYARPKKGGYGLLQMQTQLQGHRAAVLISTLGEDKDWYTKYFRLKLIHHMGKIMSGDRQTPATMARNLHCADFLLETTGRFFKNLGWTFTPNEICYLKAWEQVVPRTRVYTSSTLAPDDMIRPNFEALARGNDGFSLTPDEEKVCHPDNFRSLSKRKQEALPPIMPRRFLELCPEANSKRRWEKFWKRLHTLEWKKHKDFKALHHFNFGSYVPIHDARTSVRGSKCHLCLQNVDLRQILSHLYNDCGCTNIVWNSLRMQTPMTLNSMVAPSNHTFRYLRNLNWYVETVRRVYLSRRREELGGVVLQDLLARELKRALARSKALTS